MMGATVIGDTVNFAITAKIRKSNVNLILYEKEKEQ